MGLVTEMLDGVLRDVARTPDTAPADLAVPLGAALEHPVDPVRLRGEPQPHPADTHPPDRQRIEAVGGAIEQAVADAVRPASIADRDAARALFADWDGLARRLAGLLQGRAAAGLEAWRSDAEAAAGAVGHDEVVLLPALRRAAITGAVAGGVCLLMVAGCSWAAFFGAADDRYAWPLLVWDGLGLAGLVGVLWGLWRLWRGRGKPFLVLGIEGFSSRGLVGEISWLSVASVAVSPWGAPTIGIRLRPGATLPARTGAIRRAQVNAKLRDIQFNGVMPRGMDARTLQATLVRYVEAARARAAMAMQRDRSAEVRHPGDGGGGTAMPLSPSTDPTSRP